MRIAAVIAAALVALVAWYLLRDRRLQPAPAPHARSSAQGAPVAPATTPPAIPSTTRPALPAADSDDPTALVDATHAVMQEIGRDCFAKRTPRAVASNEPDDTVGRLELRLGIRVADGTARVESADVVATRRLRDDLRDCIVAASRTAGWAVAASDGAHEITELFRMGDYVAVPRPDSPPSSAPTR
jgi:hypothetical protein